MGGGLGRNKGAALLRQAFPGFWRSGALRSGALIYQYSSTRARHAFASSGSRLGAFSLEVNRLALVILAGIIAAPSRLGICRSAAVACASRLPMVVLIACLRGSPCAFPSAPKVIAFFG